MKRITLVIVLLACGVLAAATPLFAQAAAPAADNWFTGKATMLLLGRDNVDSSKFTEYREVPKGVSMPVFSLQGSHNGTDFALFGQNISQQDQRYSGYADMTWLGVDFGYNSIVHNMGFNGHTLETETAPGVWSMNGTTRKALGDAVDAVATTARIYPFYADLLAPTIAAANSVDLTSLRQRGDVALDLGKKLPFDLTFTYMRELKTGARGASGGDILGTVTSAIDVPEPLNEMTQDIGVRWAYAFKAGNVHASFNRNLYNDRVNALIIDNPFRATDLLYTATSAPGGPAQVRFSTSPDNEATRGAFGVQLKFAHQTRITADMAMNTWTQNDAFLPYTINSTALTATGAATNTVASLQQQSLDGKINTSMVNVSFSSRPVQGLGIRLRYRTYDLTNKTNRFVITGDASSSPDRAWSAVTPSVDDPYGHATANVYDNSSKRFDGQVSYDIKGLTIEGSMRNTRLERTGREATSGDENGYGVAAVYHASDLVGIRATADSLKRTAKGWPTTTLGLQSDEAEKKTTRTGVDIELTPSDAFGVTFAYFRRNDDYPNRPNRAAGVADTSIGLLSAKYDTYTVDAEFTPNERTELSAYYTYEKNASVNRTVTLTGTAVNNNIRFDASDKGNTFGANAMFHFVPEKWTFTLMVRRQKVDGLFDVTANVGGAFYNSRATLTPPGAQDITDYDDTTLTTAMVDLACAVSKAVTFSVGYAYDKYSHADAFSDGTTIFPQAVLFFMKANDGGYKANVAYTKLTYRF